MMHIPGYTNLEKISEGGFGSIFKAQGALDKKIKVAVKVGEPDKIDRERKLLKSMKHDNIVEVVDHGEGWYAMPEADACLREVVGTFSVDEAVEVGKQLASALDYIHNLEHVHRDIKPDNILFVNGKPKLADMGLCQRVETHVGSWDKTADKAGTDHYVAPEVEAGEPFDHRADLFSLGMTLYELVTGENRMLKPIEHSGFNEIVNKLTEPNPDKRYGSAKELMEDLGKLSREAVASQMVEQPVINPERKNNYLPHIIGIGTLALLTVLGFGSWIADFIPMPKIQHTNSKTKAPRLRIPYESQNKLVVENKVDVNINLKQEEEDPFKNYGQFSLGPAERFDVRAQNQWKDRRWQNIMINKKIDLDAEFSDAFAQYGEDIYLYMSSGSLIGQLGRGAKGYNPYGKMEIPQDGWRDHVAFSFDRPGDSICIETNEGKYFKVTLHKREKIGSRTEVYWLRRQEMKFR